MEFEKLRQIISDVLNLDVEEITMETAFVAELGADSLDLYQIVIRVEEEFDIDLLEQEIESIVTVADALDRIQSTLRG